MKAVIQRVNSASCTVESKITGQIAKGLVVLLGVGLEDKEDDAKKLAEKISNLRIFPEGEKEFDKSILDIGGGVLAISQFTLYANTKGSRRPDFINAAKGDIAKPLYENFVTELKAKGIKVEEGVFGAMMDINLSNSGPVTIIIDSKEL